MFACLPQEKFTHLVLYVERNRTNDQLGGGTCIVSAMCNKRATGADLSEGGAPTQGDNPDVIPSHVAGMAGSFAVLGGFMCQLDTS